MYWRMCYNVKGAKCRKDRKIMAVIYENKVKELGKDIMMMNGGDFIIIFGDSAPAELRDLLFCRCESNQWRNQSRTDIKD